MDFFAEKSDLVKELNFVRNAVEKRSTIPVLSHILLEAEGFELRITATDLEITARTTCQAKVKTKGAAVVPGLRFLEIVRSAGTGEIRCRGLESHAVQVTYGRSSFKLVGLAKGDFPKVPAVPIVHRNVGRRHTGRLREKDLRSSCQRRKTGMC